MPVGQAAGRGDRPAASGLVRRTWVTVTPKRLETCINPTLGEIRRMTRSQGAFRTERAAVLHCPQLRYSSTQNSRSPARYWNPSSSTLRSARSSACAQDRWAPCSRAALEDAAGRCVEYARDVYGADRASF